MIDYLIGPTLLSGMGQHLFKYKGIFENAKYIEINNFTNIEKDSNVMIYALPLPEWINCVKVLKTITDKLICMTVCETETVHPAYGELIEAAGTVAVPSEFCKNIFEKNFPNFKFKIVHAHVPLPDLKSIPLSNRFGIPKSKYIFYHIGNIVDMRKNIPDVLRAFQELNLPDCIMVMKATCKKEVKVDIPNVYILNKLQPQKIIDHLHNICDCYVSFSSSEGIGLGAVEAAMCDKPVIAPEFGGMTNYIKTPFTIRCGRQEVPRDDFLFQKGMIWGKPDYEQLKEFMLKCYNDNIKTMDHSFTREVVSKESVYEEVRTLFHL
jgi:glycosyltransferase involved in cell wall biosynthesis